jgi:nicotinamide-nucleotide adenylyltransferase
VRARISGAIAALDATGVPALTVVAGVERLRQARHVGILSGSFNPPTLAHAALATGALQAGQLDAVIWTISRVTVDKETVTRAPLEDRLIALTALMETRSHDAVALVNRGLYVDQIDAIRAALSHIAQITFIIGFDKIVQIVDPHYYANRDAALDELFSRADILVAPRDGDTESDLSALFALPENRRWAGSVRYLPLDPTLRDFSSSHARQRIDQHQSIDSLVPPEALALVDAGAFVAL